MKNKIILIAIASLSFLLTGCEQKNKWTIVTDPQGYYGYVSWDGEVNGGYKTYEEAQKACDEKKKWAEEWDAKWDNEHSDGYYKKADR